MNSTGNDNDACTDIAVLSRVCSKEGYQSQRRYQNADDIVGQVSRVVVRSLTPHSSFAAFRRPPARCKAAIQTLSCSLVFPQCRIDSSATQPLPHYSVLLNGVANACGMGVDNLSGRLLATLSQRQDERALTRHWRTPLARISENWNWAQDKLVWHPSVHESDGGAIGDLAVCAAMLFALWWFGVWLVRQWSRDVARAFSQVHRPLATSTCPIVAPRKAADDIAIEVSN